jgi:undecaprenyl diphosphate synthase
LVDQSSDDKNLQDELRNNGSVPEHVAVIMDGNGRWAKQRALPRVAGHREGVNSVRDIVDACGQLGVKCLTLYAFSTENWKRPEREVSTLMRLLVKALKDETDKLYENNVRLTAIGDLESLPAGVQREILDAFERTKTNTGLNLNLALSYSGRWEITEAVKRMVADALAGRISVEDINESVVSSYLTTSAIPDPDLLIRIGGEFRLSNFLLYQLAYTEIYISKVFWPDFRRKHLYEAIRDFQKRERRFGLVSEQIRHLQTL